MSNLILLDMQMPNMDGVDVLKELQKKYLRVLIYFFSVPNATLILKMIELGASAFMAKNVKPDELMKTIKNVET